MRRRNSDQLRTLTRGIEVMRALAQRRGSTLHSLHERTNLAKPSLLRILSTLEHMNIARRDHLGVWSCSVNGWPQLCNDFDALLLTVGAAELDRLVERIAWPSDLMIYRDGMMEVIVTNRPETPYPVGQMRVGDRAHVLQSATGRCWLAYCTDEERAAICARLTKSDDRLDSLARKPGAIDSLVEHVRASGYAARSPGYRASDREAAISASAIALPVFNRRNIVACLNVVWDNRFADAAQFATENLSMLERAANAIGNRLDMSGYSRSDRAPSASGYSKGVRGRRVQPSRDAAASRRIQRNPM